MLCPHCSEMLAKSTYYSHKSLYFRDGVWSKNEEKLRQESCDDNSGITFYIFSLHN